MKKAVRRTTGGLSLTDDSNIDDRKRVSNWFILINSNKRYTSLEDCEAIYSKILGATSHIFADPEGNPGRHLKEVMDWKVESLKPWSMKIVEKGEIGDKQLRVHVHMNLTVKHWGRLQLRYKLIRRLYKRYCTQPDDRLEFGFNPFVDIQNYQTEAGAAHYLGKGRVLAEDLEVLPRRLEALSLHQGETETE